MIRQFAETDIPAAQAIHAANELPENCFPNLIIDTPQGRAEANPLFVVKGVYLYEGKPALMSFLKITGELYLLVDHKVGTPEKRWEWLCEFREWMVREAWRLGLEQITAWLPPEIEESFGKRMLEMGFVKSPYSAYTLNLE